MSVQSNSSAVRVKPTVSPSSIFSRAATIAWVSNLRVRSSKPSAPAVVQSQSSCRFTSAYDQHLAECKKCREKLNWLKKLVHDQQFENREACAEIRGELEAYALGRASKVQTEAVLNHAGECHNCNALLSLLPKAFTFDDVELSDIPVSENLVVRIGRALDQKLDGSSAHPDVKKNKNERDCRRCKRLHR